jgi:hypothetical protein
MENGEGGVDGSSSLFSISSQSLVEPPEIKSFLSSAHNPCEDDNDFQIQTWINQFENQRKKL